MNDTSNGTAFERDLRTALAARMPLDIPAKLHDGVSRLAMPALPGVLGFVPGFTGHPTSVLGASGRPWWVSPECSLWR